MTLLIAPLDSSACFSSTCLAANPGYCFASSAIPERQLSASETLENDTNAQLTFLPSRRIRSVTASTVPNLPKISVSLPSSSMLPWTPPTCRQVGAIARISAPNNTRCSNRCNSNTEETKSCHIVQDVKFQDNGCCWCCCCLDYRSAVPSRLRKLRMAQAHITSPSECLRPLFIRCHRCKAANTTTRALNKSDSYTMGIHAPIIPIAP